MGVGVVVPLDGDEVGVKGEEGRRHQTLLLRPPKTGRQRYVAQLVKNLGKMIWSFIQLWQP